MFKDVISIPKKKYLGIGITMPWENNLELQFGLWEGVACGMLEKLKKLSGGDNPIRLFCCRCDMNAHTFSYHIACENRLNAMDAEFEDIRLNATDYARFKTECKDISHRFESYNALCNEIWGQWLPSSDYVSLIEPETFACIGGRI